MAEEIKKIKVRTDTEANWTNANPVLDEGELAVVVPSTGAPMLFVGDGSTNIMDLMPVGGGLAQ